ncbi:C-type lectin domain family 4 member E-like [Epinephelus fuscoguttatus]|uniref:C-type lectin domain family 4 member E-like n=1 Tax=Epinephelus fuscoguttatus TaxID=293821 RepID=UPI0020D1A132|nr:C-type lectin domain family 4 member E-like [Epinephelus fuscoguttatus]
MDVYINEGGPSGYPHKRKSLENSTESIYENVMIHSLEPNRTGPALSGAADVKKSPCRAAAVCLSLLCLLLLTGLITLACLFTKSNSEWKMELVLVHNSNNNLTMERDQLQTSNNNLTKERDQLQTSYNILADERDRLHKGVKDMTKKINDLHKTLQACYSKQGWTYFRGSLYYISSTTAPWQQSRSDCQQRGADLVIINSKEEQEFVRRFQKVLWIGLTDTETERKWKWVDGTLLTTSYWARGEPNGHLFGRDEDCAEIMNFNLENSWNDDSCYQQKSWICEKTWPV